MAKHLLKEPHGAEKIRDMIRDDIREALKRDDRTMPASSSWP
jgi:hypothetical protein